MPNAIAFARDAFPPEASPRQDGFHDVLPPASELAIPHSYACDWHKIEHLGTKLIWISLVASVELGSAHLKEPVLCIVLR